MFGVGVLGHVLVSSGCYNKYHRLGGLNNKHLLLTVLKAVKAKMKALADLVSDRSQIPGL